MNATLAPSYEDSAEFASLLASLETGWTYTTERRAAAAKLGWLRRRGLIAPEPWPVFKAAVLATDPRAVRLFICDQVSSVQHHFLAKYPNDMCTLEVIAAARRYANGEASDQERRRVLKPVRPLLEWIDRDDPASCALQAACFCIVKPILWAAHWGLDWAMLADHPRATRPLDFAHYAGVFAALAHKAA